MDQLKNPENSNPASRQQEYWRRNVRIMQGLLVVWFLVSFGVEFSKNRLINSVRWIQAGLLVCAAGSIYVFVVLIFYTCVL